MTYRSLYRAYRPQRFEEVVGQDHITRTLRNALKQGRVGHAYLFAGPRGTGKTSIARLLAKAVNCPQRDPDTAEPCDACDLCRSIRDGSALDVIEIDAASNRGIDEIRDLRDKVRYAPGRCAFKVYIIDEVHMLTDAAFNALLKTLEDPPPQVIFILATTDVQKIPVTIQSRCQRFDFRRLSPSQIATHLSDLCAREGIVADDRALVRIAQQAGGGMRDALSLLEQARALSDDGRLTLEHLLLLLGSAGEDWLLDLTDAAIDGDYRRGFDLIDDALAGGRDPAQLLKDWLGHLRNLLVLALGSPSRNSAPGDDGEQTVAKRQAERLGVAPLLELIEHLCERENVMRWAPDGRIVLETAFVRAVRLCAVQGGRVAATAVEADPRVGSKATLERPGQDKVGPDPSPDATRTELAASVEPGPQALGDRAPAPAVWPQIKERLRRRSPIVSAYAEPAVPLVLEPGRLVLGFSREHEFHRGRMEAEGSRRLLADVVRSVCSFDVRIEYVTIPADSTGGTREHHDHQGRERRDDDGEPSLPSVEASPSPRHDTELLPTTGHVAGERGLPALAFELFGGEFVPPREDLL